MRQKYFWTLTAASLLLICGFSKAEEGRVAGLTLLHSVGARPAGMGEAFVAAPADVQGMSFNPASLAKIPCPELAASYNNGIFEDSFGDIAYAHSLSFGSIFVGGTFYDAGNFEDDSSGAVQTKTAQRDMVGNLGLAFGKDSPLSLGVNAKYFKSTLAEQTSAAGMAFDGGLAWKTPIRGLAFGAALQNLGADLKYEVESEPLPQTMRGGVAYEANMDEWKSLGIPWHVLVDVDGVKTKNQEASVNSGLEVRRDMNVMDQDGYAALRGGYESGPSRFSAGVGFKIGGFVLDYAIGFSKDNLDLINKVTLGWVFAPPMKKIGQQHLN